MNVKFQDIQPKRAGLRCEIQVINNQGHGVLTTYEPGVDNSVEIAQADLTAFFDECIASFNRGGYSSSLKPLVNGRRIGAGVEENELLDIKAPDFDLSLFEQITIMPVLLSGG